MNKTRHNRRVSKTANRCLFIEPLEDRRMLTPVVWPVDAGGNGHAYELVQALSTISWAAARSAAQAAGGDLATITSAAENDFIVANFGPSLVNAWVGGYQILRHPITANPVADGDGSRESLGLSQTGAQANPAMATSLGLQTKSISHSGIRRAAGTMFRTQTDIIMLVI
jgi:hypothetical protein